MLFETKVSQKLNSQQRILGGSILVAFDRISEERSFAKRAIRIYFAVENSVIFLATIKQW